MSQTMKPLQRLLYTIWKGVRHAWTWKQNPPGESVPHTGSSRTRPLPSALPVEGEAFEAFLHQLGVQLERPARAARQGWTLTPTITLLGQSRHYQALYRVDLVDHHPHVLVLIPAEHPLLFEGYLLRLRTTHPLAVVFERLASFQGSQPFERERPRLEEEVLFALTESMKALFWAGLPTGRFPREIIVQKLEVIGEILQREPEE